MARLLTEDWAPLAAKLIVDTRLLEANVGKEIFEANCYELFRTADECVLPVLYDAYKPKLHHFSQFLAYFFEYIIKEGEKLSKGKEVDFEKLYEFYNLNFEMNKKLFKSDSSIKIELNRAFEKFNNENNDQAAELLSKYIADELVIKRGLEELNEKIQCAMVLFKHLGSKDIFISFYNQR